MHNEDENPTTVDLIVHDPVEPVTDPEPIHYGLIEPPPAVQEPQPVFSPAVTSAKHLHFIYVTIKDIRRGDYGLGEDREQNLLDAGFSHNSVIALIYEADKPK